ncbi:MAG: intracellular septation protein [Planctomycetota bacterium]|jgi:intracellular septation protein
MTENTDENQEPAGPHLGPLAKLAVEAGPLVVFFMTNSIAKKRLEDPGDSLFWATGTFMAAIVISLLVSWKVERRIPPMAAFTAVFVLIFGGLTLYLQDDFFIKVKSTIINVLFAGILGVGLMTGRTLLKVVLGEAIQMRDAGWRTLTIRWVFYFLFLALANEVVWRNFSDDTWVSFKSFGVMPLTIIFSLLQLPLMQKHQIEESGDGANAA